MNKNSNLMHSMNSIISCKNIYKSFGKIEVLKGIDLSILESEIVSIVGPSGSGKTTYFKY